MVRHIDSPLAADFAKLIELQAQPSTPVNFQHQSEAMIEGAAEYAVTVARYLLGNLTDLGIDLAGKRFLELGPGPGFGSTLVMGQRCAVVAEADRFLAGWQPQFHPRLYEHNATVDRRAFHDFWTRCRPVEELGKIGAAIVFYKPKPEDIQ